MTAEKHQPVSARVSWVAPQFSRIRCSVWLALAACVSCSAQTDDGVVTRQARAEACTQLAAQVEAARAASINAPERNPRGSSGSSESPANDDLTLDEAESLPTPIETDAESSLGGVALLERREASSPRGIPSVELLDDGEDGDNNPLQGGPDLKGYWYTADDSWECGNTRPYGFTSPIPTDNPGGTVFTTTEYAAEGIDPPPETYAKYNNYGFRFWGGRHQSFGALLGVGLNNEGTPSPANLVSLGFVGVRFWGLAPCGSVELLVQVPDKYSDPGQGLCIPQDYTSCSGAQGCHHSPVARVTLTDEWQLFEIPLTDFVRPDTGVYMDGIEPPSQLDAAAAMQIQFVVSPTPLFDVWLDDIGFMYSL